LGVILHSQTKLPASLLPNTSIRMREGNNRNRGLLFGTYERTMSERTVYPGTLTYPWTVPTIELFRPV